MPGRKPTSTRAPSLVANLVACSGAAAGVRVVTAFRRRQQHSSLATSYTGLQLSSDLGAIRTRSNLVRIW